jgi:hypothetical protein
VKGQELLATVDAETLREAVKTQVCPFCGRGPYRVLLQHVAKAHHIDKRLFKTAAGMFWMESACDPSYTAVHKIRQAKTLRLLHETGRRGSRLGRRGTSPKASKMLSDAVRKRFLALDPVVANEHMRKISAISNAARPLPEHGTLGRYRSRRDPCRCELCVEAKHAYNRREAARMRDSRQRAKETA